MTTLAIGRLSKLIANIDIAMLATRRADGGLTARPMSNNGRVEYEGDSFYFVPETSLIVSEIEREPHVSLSFHGRPGLFTKSLFFVTVEGEAVIVRDQMEFADRWSAGLIRWFPQGVRTKDMVMIHVKASRIRYWLDNESGEIIR